MIQALASEDSYFFLHIDAKSDIRAFHAPSRYIQYTARRHSVYWGGFAQALAQKEVLRTCFSSGIPFDRVFILSGQDYPLWSQEKIMRELCANPKKEYVKGYNITAGNEPRQLRKVVLYHFFRDANLPRNFKRALVFGTRTLLRLLPIRKRPFLRGGEGRRVDIWCGSAFMCLTSACARYVLDQMENNKPLMRYFKTAITSDEMVIPTLVFNSEYGKFATAVAGSYKGLKTLAAVSYFNYGRAIQVFDASNFDELKNSGMMFARKFQSGVSDSLIELVEQDKKRSAASSQPPAGTAV